MLIELFAYSLIAFQLDLVLCRPQRHGFNGSNPYYDSYLDQYGGQNSYMNINQHNPCKYHELMKSINEICMFMFAKFKLVYYINEWIVIVRL